MARAILLALLLLQEQAKPDPELEAKRTKIAATLEAIRGAKFDKTVPVRAGERKEYGTNALENAKLLYGDDLAVAGRALKSLGLISGRIRLDLAIPTLALAAKVQAFYRNGELVIVDRESPDDELLYKLALGLADQRFKVREGAAKLGTNFDAQMAWAAMQHGEADMCKQLMWAGKKTSDKMPDEHLKKLAAGADKWEREDSKWASAVAPRIFIRAGDFIWRRGGIYIETIRQQDGMEGVDKAWAAMPTTEQILHPEKRGKDLPAIVDTRTLEDAMAAGKWKRVYKTTLGELGTAILLETHLKDEIEKASPGWGGDTLCTFEDEAGKPLTVWATSWDSADDAAEFHAAIQRVSNAFATEKTTFNYALRRGTNVALVIGSTKAIEDALLDGLWKCTVKRGDKEEKFGKE